MVWKGDRWDGRVGWIVTPLVITFEDIVLCALVCRMGYFDCHMREIVVCKFRGLTYSPLWEDVTDYLHGMFLQNNLHSLSLS